MIFEINFTKIINNENLKFFIKYGLKILLGEKGERRGIFLYSSIISLMQWFEDDIQITIMSAIYFLA